MCGCMGVWLNVVLRAWVCVWVYKCVAGCVLLRVCMRVVVWVYGWLYVVLGVCMCGCGCGCGCEGVWLDEAYCIILLMILSKPPGEISDHVWARWHSARHVTGHVTRV